MNRTEIDSRDDEIAASAHVLTPAPSVRASRSAYVLAPLIFLAVTALGGMRLAPQDDSFVFLKPEPIALILASFTLVLIFRSGALSFAGWLGDAGPAHKKAANAAILLGLFTATTQLYNSLLPEKGVLHWVFVFCFFWAIATGIMANLPAVRTVASLTALFAIAFVSKYVILGSLSSPAEMSWIERVWDSPGREAAALILGRPEFSPATGYIQFLAGALYILGLYLLPRRI